MSQAVWLSWENHRRSREMSKSLGVPFHVIRGLKGPLCYPLMPFLASVRTLLSTTADTVIVQNPSLLLTVLACALKPVKRFRVIQDLHSYFAQHIHEGIGFRGKVYRLLSLFCIRRADLTIVTNPELKKVIEDAGGRGFVLQDGIPVFPAPVVKNVAERRVVYVCTYSADEPVEAVLAAGKALSGETTIYVTGKIPANFKTWEVPRGVVLTGFLPEQAYLDLLGGADAVMALTTRDLTLLCGAYEGLAFTKPLVLSNKAALRNYFGDSIVYVENDANSIVEGIRRMYASKPFFDRQITELVRTLNRDWADRFEELRLFVSGSPVKA